MSRKLTRNTSNRKSHSSARQDIRAHDLQPGCIAWLPTSAIDKSQMIRRFEYNHNVQSTDIDQVLPSEAYNHPVVILEIMNLPSRGDDYVIVAMVRLPQPIDDMLERNQKLSLTPLIVNFLWKHYRIQGHKSAPYPRDNSLGLPPCYLSEHAPFK